jgi:hypothetical protein
MIRSLRRKLMGKRGGATTTPTPTSTSMSTYQPSNKYTLSRGEIRELGIGGPLTSEKICNLIIGTVNLGGGKNPLEFISDSNKSLLYEFQQKMEDTNGITQLIDFAKTDNQEHNKKVEKLTDYFYKIMLADRPCCLALSGMPGGTVALEGFSLKDWIELVDTKNAPTMDGGEGDGHLDGENFIDKPEQRFNPINHSNVSSMIDSFTSPPALPTEADSLPGMPDPSPDGPRPPTTTFDHVYNVLMSKSKWEKQKAINNIKETIFKRPMKLIDSKFKEDSKTLTMELVYGLIVYDLYCFKFLHDISTSPPVHPVKAPDLPIVLESVNQLYTNIVNYTPSIDERSNSIVRELLTLKHDVLPNLIVLALQEPTERNGNAKGVIINNLKENGYTVIEYPLNNPGEDRAALPCIIVAHSNQLTITAQGPPTDYPSEVFNHFFSDEYPNFVRNVDTNYTPEGSSSDRGQLAQHFNSKSVYVELNISHNKKNRTLRFLNIHGKSHKADKVDILDFDSLITNLHSKTNNKQAADIILGDLNLEEKNQSSSIEILSNKSDLHAPTSVKSRSCTTPQYKKWILLDDNLVQKKQASSEMKDFISSNIQFNSQVKLFPEDTKLLTSSWPQDHKMVYISGELSVF